jgi:hypothetical protein
MAKKREFKKLTNVVLKDCCIKELKYLQGEIKDLQTLKKFVAFGSLLTIFDPEPLHMLALIELADWERLAQSVDTLGAVFGGQFCMVAVGHQMHGSHTKEQLDFWQSLAEAYHPGGAGGDCGM